MLRVKIVVWTLVNWVVTLLFFVIVASAASKSAYAMDFDKEIAKQDRVSVTLANDVAGKPEIDEAKDLNQAKTKDFRVRLIKKGKGA